MTAIDQVLVFDTDEARAASIVALLETSQPWTGKRQVRSFQEFRNDSKEPSAGVQEMQSGLAALAIVVEDGRSILAFPNLVTIARLHGIATLAVIDATCHPIELARRVKDYDGWVALEAVDRELAGRVASTLDRAEQQSKVGTRLPTIDPHFMSLIIHDIRTPLNVIGLTIRAIMQTVPVRSAELEEDLLFLRENAAQIEKMLAQLGDYCRLIQAELQASAVEFDPRRFLADFVEVHQAKQATDASQVLLDLSDICPIEVALDPNRVRLALQHALSNAANAAAGSPVRIRSSGGPDRWIIELIVDKPPPQTVISMSLQPDQFERLAGAPAERRGLDLAIAARISELFGGSAKLVVDPDRRTTILLDWPSRMADQ